MQAAVSLIGGAVVPCAFVLVVGYALFCRVDVFSAFTEGAAEALPVLVRVLPYLAGMLMAIQVLRAGGLLDALTEWLAPCCAAIGFDAKLLPLVLLRPLSGSGSMAIVAELYKTHGVDSFVCFTASILMGSSETIFYETALYFGSIGVTDTKWTVPAALLISLVAAVASVIIAGLFY